MYKKIKVLVVDDSIFMRRVIISILKTCEDIEVVDYATNGVEALEKTAILRPDVITMDVEMPVMDGITALKHIMEKCPTPIVMLSTLTERGAETTVKALTMGAIDYVLKPSSYTTDLHFVKEEIISKVLKAYKANLRVKPSIISVKVPKYYRRNIEVIFIGVSTGGPKTLYDIIPKFPENLGVPVFVIQHMPEMFTKSFAENLNKCSNIKVKEAEDGEEVKKNVIYIAQGGRQLELKSIIGKGIFISISKGPEDALYKPCVDISGYSITKIYKEKTLGIILTGMGRDGEEAFKYIKQCGGTTIAEAESTAVIFGMPKVVIDDGNADIISPSYEITEHILKLLSI